MVGLVCNHPETSQFFEFVFAISVKLKIESKKGEFVSIAQQASVSWHFYFCTVVNLTSRKHRQKTEARSVSCQYGKGREVRVRLFPSLLVRT